MTREGRAIDVAVGVVIRGDGAVLLGQRVPGKPYAGWWEFPGGKLEAGESVAQALARELHEELGIEVRESFAWVVREFVYPHARVRLHFRRVFDFEGEPHSREGQAFVWCRPDAIDVAPLLPATVPVIGWLRLPTLWIDCSSPTADERAIESAVARARRPAVLVLDAPSIARQRFEARFYRIRSLASALGAKLLVGAAHPPSYARAADGVLLGPTQLRAIDARPPGALVAARCESVPDVERAAALGIDCVLVGSGLAGRCAESAGVPMIGVEERCPRGVDACLDSSRRLGVHGVALPAAFWHDERPRS